MTANSEAFPAARAADRDLHIGTVRRRQWLARIGPGGGVAMPSITGE
ncbi:hypothetical protein ACFRAI_38470 [Streptomyces sp. NPDC056637]